MTIWTIGIGLRPGTDSTTILAAIREILGDNPLRCLATIDRRADEPGLVAAAAELGVPIFTFSAKKLAEVTVPNPSRHSQETLGTPSVAEAAAILTSGTLTIQRQVIGGVVVAAGVIPGRLKPRSC